MEASGSKPIKEEILATDKMNRIDPIKNYIVQCSSGDIRLRRIKGQGGRVLTFGSNGYYSDQKKVFKGFFCDRKSQKKVQKLSLKWCDTPSLLRVLRKKTWLRELSIKFYTDITDVGFNSLKTSLKRMKYLRHLHFQFLRSAQITDERMSCLQKGLRFINSIHSLSLNFTCCEEITDDGLDHLKEGLENLVFLRQLSLVFNSCLKITDAGVNIMKKGLEASKSLQHLYLSFFGCAKITDIGMIHLGEILRRLSLRPLRHLSLDFTWCNLITDVGLGYLEGPLKTLNDLKHVSLIFYGRGKNMDKKKSDLRKGLKKLPSVVKIEVR